MIINILSERLFQTWPSWSVVFEWEDAFEKMPEYQVQLRSNTFWGKVKRRIRAKMTDKWHLFSNFNFDGKTINLAWIMNAKDWRSYTQRNVIPCFLDFPADMVNVICSATQKLPCYFVTSKDIYDRLVESGSKNVYYMPLSISDRYKSITLPPKEIDVIQFGRKNKILHEWMLKYCKEHPETDYVYQTGDGTLAYYSTVRGEIGRFDSRGEYLKLLVKCKVSLVSSPGIDKSRDFGGIDFFTPRFFESAALRCRMLGRYTENIEAEILEIDTICPNVANYEQFQMLLTKYISDNENKEFGLNWLDKHWSSIRANFVLSIIKSVIEKSLI